MTVRLSEGALMTIMNGGEIDQPIMQILGHKKITANGTNERYRLLISDGVHVNSFAMLATQLNEKVTNGELSDNCVVRINRHIISNVSTSSGKGSNKRVLIILDLTVLVSGDDIAGKLGDPVPLIEGSVNSGNEQTVDHTSSNEIPSSNSLISNNVPQRALLQQFDDTTSDIDSCNTKIQPIASLNPFQTKWVIKARIVSKTNLRTWSNNRAEGKLFSVDLIDSSSSIRATAFNDQAEKFYDMMELNKVYYISKCLLKPANRKFTSLKHDFEMAFTNETQVIPCYENDLNIPHLEHDFIAFNMLKDLPVGSFVDVIGICHSCTNLQTFTSRTSGKELKKREITLVDRTLASIALTLWDVQAEQFDGSLQPVVAVKAARITEYAGSKSLSLIGSSVVQMNPDIAEAHRIRGWYDCLPANVQFDNMSTKIDSGSGKLWTIKEARLNNVGAGDKADYFNTEATVFFVQSNKAVYQACPTPECQKKVIDQNNGMFRCEKCNMEYPNFKYRLMLSVQICDWTSTQWVTVFQEAAETLLSTTAQEIGVKLESHQKCDSYFKRPLFSSYLFRLRAKMETFNNETRLRMSVVSVKNIDYRESCITMLNSIKQITGVSITQS